MRRLGVHAVLVTGLLIVLGVGSYALAGGGDKKFRENMTGYQEVPALSTDGSGRFELEIKDNSSMSYRLTYGDLSSPATQAHIHFGQRSVVGGISAFLCSNLGNGPAGTQPCPPNGGTITGTLVASDVIGPAGQGISAGEFTELLAAIRAGVAYANVHSVTFPGGEIRAQLDGGSAKN
jgi:CHRD domain